MILRTTARTTTGEQEEQEERREREEDFDVDETLDASFPASDPPAWTATHAGTPAMDRGTDETR